MPELVFGVALRASPNRLSSVVCLGGEEKPKLCWVKTFTEDRELLSIVDRCKPQLIGVGDPLTWPSGLHCLESTCPCAPRSNQKGRQAERELAELRLSTFFTMKESVIKPLIYRGVRLGIQLGARAKVIEVSPPATAVLLFGDEVPRRRAPKKRVRFLKDAFSEKIEGMADWDQVIDQWVCQALLAAFTAWLHVHNQTDAVGDAREGQIMVPRGKIISVAR